MEGLLLLGRANIVIKCKPAVAWEHGKPLSIERVEVAPPRAHKVRIKQVECATLTRGTSMRLVYACIPLVLGHKGSGVVEGASPGVSKFSPGKPVRIIAIFCVPPPPCHNTTDGLKRIEKEINSTNELLTTHTC
uniref:Alcohol dehydrogenase-like N-terminal domain-containing protein n=1 Tax=Oncorhynchus tshawytscha TaxID=74940 RepID=A0AAZ3PTX6_ONCTS